MDIHGVGDTVRFVCTARKEARDCVAERRSIRQEMFEEQLASVIDVIRLPPNYKAQALALLQTIDPESNEARILKRRDALMAELERCKHTYKADVRQIQYELAGLPPMPSVEQRAEVLDEVAGLLADLGALWGGATDEERRDIARALFASVWVDLDGRRVVAVQMKSTLRTLRNVLDTGLSSDTTYSQLRNRRDSRTRDVHNPTAYTADCIAA